MVGGERPRRAAGGGGGASSVRYGTAAAARAARARRRRLLRCVNAASLFEGSRCVGALAPAVTGLGVGAGSASENAPPHRGKEKNERTSAALAGLGGSGGRGGAVP